MLFGDTLRADRGALCMLPPSHSKVACDVMVAPAAADAADASPVVSALSSSAGVCDALPVLLVGLECWFC
jgi:hypothetical protein